MESKGKAGQVRGSGTSKSEQQSNQKPYKNEEWKRKTRRGGKGGEERKTESLRQETARLKQVETHDQQPKKKKKKKNPEKNGRKEGAIRGGWGRG